MIIIITAGKPRYVSHDEKKSLIFVPGNRKVNPTPRYGNETGHSLRLYFIIQNEQSFSIRDVAGRNKCNNMENFIIVSKGTFIVFSLAFFNAEYVNGANLIPI